MSSLTGPARPRRIGVSALIRTLPVTALLAGCLAALGGSDGAAAEGLAAFPGANGRITFATRLTENGDVHDQIYSMNADGSDKKRLTNNAAQEGSPTWSPDGTTIAFTSSRNGGNDLYVMNADGTNQHQLTTGLPAGSARWSPDGTKIAFQGYIEDSRYEIFVVNADGTNLVRLTHNPGYDQAPQWSPDGARILYMTDKDHDPEHYDIYTIKPDGTDENQLTSNARSDHVPQWSPDGTKITFQSHVGPGKDEIYVMNADGSVQTPLTNDNNYDWGPTWSPDGSKIAFESSRNNRRQVFAINPDGTGQTQLTNSSNGSASPVWSPDGKRIGFSDNISSPGINTPELWVMNRDGSGKTRLTTDSLAHYGMDWQRVRPALRIDDASVSETAGQVTVTVRSDKPSALPVTVIYGTRACPLNGLRRGRGARS